MAIVPGDHLEGHSDSDNPIWRNFLFLIFLIFESKFCLKTEKSGCFGDIFGWAETSLGGGGGATKKKWPSHVKKQKKV